MVARDRPLVIIEESDDIKSLEIGRLTFDESSTLDSVIQRGLGVGIDPALTNTGPEIKKEVSEPEPSIQGSLGSETDTCVQSAAEYQKAFGIKS